MLCFPAASVWGRGSQPDGFVSQGTFRGVWRPSGSSRGESATGLSWGEAKPQPGKGSLLGQWRWAGSWFSRTRLVPLESRGRPSTTGTGSGSLFPPLDSSGPQAAFSSEPTPGTSPGVPTGAQQAGEVAHPEGLACRLHGARSCGQTFGINRSLCLLFLQCLCVFPCAGQSSPRRMPCF